MSGRQSLWKVFTERKGAQVLTSQEKKRTLPILLCDNQPATCTSTATPSLKHHRVTQVETCTNFCAITISIMTALSTKHLMHRIAMCNKQRRTFPLD